MYDAIRKDPSDLAPYLVLADLLIAHGDPRGELISIQHVRETADTPALAAAEQQLLESHRALLLGDRLAEAIDAIGELEGTEEVALHWRLGLLRKVRVEASEREKEIPALVEALFEAPSAYVLEALDLQLTFDKQPVMDELLQTIATRCPTTLRELRVASRECHLRKLCEAWPRLQELRALRIGQWGGIDLGDFRLPNLEDLELIGPKQPDIEKVLRDPPQRLRRLYIDVYTHVPLELVTPLLRGAIPSLRDVGIFGNEENVDVGYIDLVGIRSIALGPITATTLSTILNGSCKQLYRLQLAFAGSVDRDEVKRVLNGELPELRELYLGEVNGQSFLRDILDAPLLAQLDVVDLVDLSDDDLTLLAEQAHRFAHLSELRIVTDGSMYDSEDERPRIEKIRAAVKKLTIVENRVLRSVRQFGDRPCSTCAPYRQGMHVTYDDLRDEKPTYPGLTFVPLTHAPAPTGRDTLLMRCTACDRYFQYRSDFEIQPSACESEEWISPLSDAEALALRTRLGVDATPAS